MPSERQSSAGLRPLGAEELQLWQVDLDGADGNWLNCSHHLTLVEIERAERFRADQARMQFVTARAALRILLGKLLSVRPELVPITLSAYGKPEILLADKLPLFFNVAHSRETVLIALSRSGPVGVDVEYFDRATDSEEVIRNSFTERERMQLAQIEDPAERHRAFFRCWTRKEAAMKADGRGLSVPLGLVEVPVAKGVVSEPVLIREEADESTVLRPWFVSDIVLAEKVAAAVAVRLPNLTPSVFQFPPALLLSE